MKKIYSAIMQQNMQGLGKLVLKQSIKSLWISLWFMFLTFPIMVVHISPLDYTISWRWKNMMYVGLTAFFSSFLWRYFMWKREMGSGDKDDNIPYVQHKIQELFSNRFIFIGFIVILIGFSLSVPFVFPINVTMVLSSALIYVVLGLGLNIVVGLAGLLDLGYVAFYAVGAYSYGLLNYHYGLGFWMALPIGAIMAAFFGILLGFPVLRLRGDYLAIVTLGFGEIIRLVLENWDKVFFGPSGISRISRPGFFGIKAMESIPMAIEYMYIIILALVVITIFFVNRLKNSRIGRAWIALREDEIACQAMGINKMKTKLTAFALGATWAGMAGVVLAAKTTLINPPTFTFMESAIFLSIVVLGGMGSIVGVILGALILYLLPEYFRDFGDLRMLIFGASMVLMMVFRPQGLISQMKTTYHYVPEEAEPEAKS